MPRRVLTDPAEVEVTCQKYLDDCKADREANTVTLKSGARMTYGSWPSTEGLALALGISYGHLMRLISKAPDNGGEGDYRGCGGVAPIETDNESNEVCTQDTLGNVDTRDVRDSVKVIRDRERKEAQQEICETLARVRLEIIREVTEAADCGLIDSKVAQLRLARLGIAAKVEADNSRKVEIVGYSAEDISALFK